MAVKLVRVEVSAVWELWRALDCHVFGRVDPDLGCRPWGPRDAADDLVRI